MPHRPLLATALATLLLSACSSSGGDSSVATDDGRDPAYLPGPDSPSSFEAGDEGCRRGIAFYKEFFGLADEQIDLGDSVTIVWFEVDPGEDLAVNFAPSANGCRTTTFV